MVNNYYLLALQLNYIKFTMEATTEWKIRAHTPVIGLRPDDLDHQIFLSLFEVNPLRGTLYCIIFYNLCREIPKISQVSF